MKSERLSDIIPALKFGRTGLGPGRITKEEARELEKSRIEWEERLLETGLFEWHEEPTGKILNLVGTYYFPVAPRLWIRNEGMRDDDFQIISNFESVIDDVPPGVQSELLFHLDIFV